MKKAQVTVFVIIGVLIVVVIVFFTMFLNRSKNSSLEKEFEFSPKNAIYDFVEQCLTKTTWDAIDHVGFSSTEEMEPYVEQNIIACINFDQFNYKIEYSDPKSTIIVNEKNIISKLSLPIVIDGASREAFNVFEVILPLGFNHPVNFNGDSKIITTPDSQLTIVIPDQTSIFDEDGNTVNSIDIEMLPTQNPNIFSNIIYDLRPDGATFSNYITLHYDYSDMQYNDLKRLSFVYDDDGRWRDLPCLNNINRKMLTCFTNHFSLFFSTDSPRFVKLNAVNKDGKFTQVAPANILDALDPDTISSILADSDAITDETFEISGFQKIGEEYYAPNAVINNLISWTKINGIISADAVQGFYWADEDQSPDFEQFWVSQDSTSNAKLFKVPIENGFNINDIEETQEYILADMNDDVPLNPPPRMGVAFFKEIGEGGFLAVVGSADEGEAPDTKYFFQWVKVEPESGWQVDIGEGPRSQDLKCECLIPDNLLANHDETECGQNLKDADLCGYGHREIFDQSFHGNLRECQNAEVICGSPNSEVVIVESDSGINFKPLKTGIEQIASNLGPSCNLALAILDTNSDAALLFNADSTIHAASTFKSVAATSLCVIDMEFCLQNGQLITNSIDEIPQPNYQQFTDQATVDVLKKIEDLTGRNGLGVVTDFLRENSGDVNQKSFMHTWCPSGTNGCVDSYENVPYCNLKSGNVPCNIVTTAKELATFYKNLNNGRLRYNGIHVNDEHQTFVRELIYDNLQKDAAFWGDLTLIDKAFTKGGSFPELSGTGHDAGIFRLNDGKEFAFAALVMGCGTTTQNIDVNEEVGREVNSWTLLIEDIV